MAEDPTPRAPRASPDDPAPDDPASFVGEGWLFAAVLAVATIAAATSAVGLPDSPMSVARIAVIPQHQV